MAAYLAKAGINCVVFERELMPRPHVGESLVPSSTRVFKDLDFLPKMEEAKFPHKFGAAWTAASDAKVYNMDFGGVSADCHVDIRFEERNQPGVSQNYTYHVDRSKFDLMLLQHANEFGAKVYEGVGVTRVDFSDPNCAAIKYNMGKKEMSTTCRIVVDASGRKTLVGNQLKWRIQDDHFDQYAIHTWFNGYDSRCMAATSRPRAILFSFTSCRLPTPGSGRFRSPRPLPALAWSRRKRISPRARNHARRSSGSASRAGLSCMKASRPRARSRCTRSRTKATTAMP